MKSIAQEDSLGCGIACVAFILKLTYKEAKNLFLDGKRRAKEEPNFYCGEIVGILENVGLSYEYKYLKKRLKHKIYRSNTIVYLRKSKKYPFGHYLVRYENKWMDPWINFPKENINAGFRKRLPGKPIYAIMSQS